MRYFDTSFLVPLAFPESTSAEVRRFFDGLHADELATSHWTQLEFASLLAREVRMGRIEPGAARDADEEFAAFLGGIAIVLPNAEDYTVARSYLGRFELGLRAPDAFHLAIATNQKAEAIHTLDKGMLRAGRMLGLPVGTGVSLPGYED